MRIMLFIKAIAAILVMGAVAGTSYLMKEYTGSVKDLPGSEENRQRTIEKKLEAKAEKGVLANNEPGEKAFKRACELLKEKSMEEAEEKLKYIVSYYPSADVATEARRILGEMNLDELLDPDVKTGKKQVIVKRGDTFTRIVRHNHTTMDSLVHLSKLMRADSRSLHPGDKLTVMPLNMRLVINTKRKTLTLWKEGTYIKEYPLRRSAYTSKSASRHFKVGSILGVEKGKIVSNHQKAYRNASKIIYLSDKSLAIRSYSDKKIAGYQLGFFLDPVDVEELTLLLRAGNDVEIKN